MDYIVKAIIFRYFLLFSCVILVSGQFRLVNELSSKSDESNITYVKINPVAVTPLSVADDQPAAVVDFGVGRGFQRSQGHIDKIDELVVNRSNELNSKLEKVKAAEEKETNLIRINVEKSATTESSSSSSTTTLSSRIGKLQESALDINKELSAFNVLPTTPAKPLDDHQFNSSKASNSRITRIRPHGFTTAATTPPPPPAQLSSTTISAFKQHQQHQQQQQRIKDSLPINTNKILIENPIYLKKPINKNRHFKSKCHCEKIQNCPKIQISISRCPPDYFMCCF